MAKLILFGAYDRFNYGDMLMPMVIHRYFERYHDDMLAKYDVRFASLTKSDMRDRDCLPSEAIMDIVPQEGDDSAVIVCGGEVIATSESALFLHNASSREEAIDMRAQVKSDPDAFASHARKELGGIWSCPYVPPPEMFGNGVYFVAAGGKIPKRGEEMTRRLAGATHVSIRDRRALEPIRATGQDVRLAPCAVSLIADGLFSDLENHDVGCDAPYFVFQCVNDDNMSPEAVAAQLRRICQTSGCKVYLTPLGYAADHDDQLILGKIADELGDLALIDKVGSLSSILSIFKGASFYIGTSLHGTITSMAYGIPYFNFKQRIGKLGAYLNSWTNDPFFERVYTPTNMGKTPWPQGLARRRSLSANAPRLAKRAAENLDVIAAKLRDR
ncbi:polysaccharide pyruvyl transferase CsaB [Shimia thalassica]|uniref:Polysaccharide pyruvyl transferase CsaB n=1 Tax=Shimia thalassica TaxID=1715693 RepID=A0A0P1IP59_9RHOB|nr:polysaccharide pyruvyl transferase family protein [Shimia thalassica]CUJ89548.1 polysaccharide pyruvyl transferase CsaB [Shimia thalassica]